MWMARLKQALPSLEQQPACFPAAPCLSTVSLLSVLDCHCVPQVLLRALRDFNLGKLTSDDTSIFLGLLNDLFPKTLEMVPRAVEKDFETKVIASDPAVIPEFNVNT
jgi:hypothetical protein